MRRTFYFYLLVDSDWVPGNHEYYYFDATAKSDALNEAFAVELITNQLGYVKYGEHQNFSPNALIQFPSQYSRCSSVNT